jgi:hypothetical protein
MVEEQRKLCPSRRFGHEFERAVLVHQLVPEARKYFGTVCGVTTLACAHASVGSLGVGDPVIPHTHFIFCESANCLSSVGCSVAIDGKFIEHERIDLSCF